MLPKRKEGVQGIGSIISHERARYLRLVKGSLGTISIGRTVDITKCSEDLAIVRDPKCGYSVYKLYLISNANTVIFKSAHSPPLPYPG